MDEPGRQLDDNTFDTEIRKQAAYWQKLLYLQDWNIDLRVSRQWEMSDHTTVAQIEWFLHRKDAILRVVHPTDLPGLAHHFINDEEADYDISIVHELLHLHFAPLHTKDTEIPEEQAINAISRAFVKLYRVPTPEGQTTPVIAPGHGHYI
jgi:hypothetical protein